MTSVCKISTDVLDAQGTVIADQNAATGVARFFESPSGLVHLDYSLVFARFWTHPDLAEYWRRKAITQAEVLVPDRVGPEFVLGVYVSCTDSKVRLTKQSLKTPISVHSDLFFQVGSV